MRSGIAASTAFSTALTKQGSVTHIIHSRCYEHQLFNSDSYTIHFLVFRNLILVVAAVEAVDNHQ